MKQQLTVEVIIAKIQEMHETADNWFPDSDEETNWYMGKAQGFEDLLDWIEGQQKAGGLTR